MDHLLDPQLQSALLKHPAITSDQAAICSLVCTSKSLCSVVLTACSGLVCIKLSCTEKQQQKPEQFAAWLNRHARLVRSLQLDLKLEMGYGFNWREAVAAIASGLREAGKTHRLQLQDCDISKVRHSAPILAALPSGLTSLCCWLEYKGPELPSVVAVTALQRLQLHYVAGYDNVTLQLPEQLQDYTALQPLSALHQLTHLGLQSIRPAHLLHLPSQLRELSADVMGSPFVGEDKQFLQLQHLTALTRLESRADLMAYRMCNRDSLPSNLRVLIWPDMDGTVAPLLRLVKLQDLQLHQCWATPVAQLLQLCRCPNSLQQVQLAYRSGEALEELATGLATLGRTGLPCVEALTIDLSRHSGFGSGLVSKGGTGQACVPAHVVQQLPKLCGLTSLIIRGLHPGKEPRLDMSKSVLDATPQQLAFALSHLTRLQQLELQGFDSLSLEYQSDANDTSRVADALAIVFGMQEGARQLARQAVADALGVASTEPSGVADLVQTIVNLPSLRCLSLGLPLHVGS